MKKILISAIIAIILCFLSFSEYLQPQNTGYIHQVISKPSNEYSTLVFIRAFHDGIWWIQVYENDYFLYEYPDEQDHG